MDKIEGKQVAFNVNSIIENIIKIPIEMQENRDSNLLEIFTNSKYCDYYNSITESGIKRYLSINSDHINQWLVYSEDKRTDKGYFIVSKNEEYLVGFCDIYSGNTIEIIEAYHKSQIADACAKFIKLELEYLRNL